jgi:Skp family chaperone for outer membrane proteins
MIRFHRLGALALTMAAATAAAAESSIAVLRLELAFDKVKLVDARSKQLRSQVQELKAAVDARRSEVEKLKTELEIRPPSHAQYGEFKEKLEVAQLRLKLFVEDQQERIAVREAELLRQSYVDLRNQIQEFAAKKGYSLVLLYSDGPLSGKRSDQLRFEMMQRSVIYSNPAFDCTTAFIEYSDQKFTSEQLPAQPTTGGNP